MDTNLKYILGFPSQAPDFLVRLEDSRTPVVKFSP